jgi:hypothetical protein
MLLITTTHIMGGKPCQLINANPPHRSPNQHPDRPTDRPTGRHPDRPTDLPTPSSLVLVLSLTITKCNIFQRILNPPILVGLQYGPRLCSVNLVVLNNCHHFHIRLSIQFIVLEFHWHQRTVILPHLEQFCTDSFPNI